MNKIIGIVGILVMGAGCGAGAASQPDAPELAAVASAAPQPDEPAQEPTPTGVSGRVERTDAGELIVVHEVMLDASVEAVWDAYTTADGWRAWVVPVVDIDFRAGGHILTHYNPTARIGDEGTNRLHIKNYIPRKLLTLQSELQQNWPEFMKQDQDTLYNVVLFEQIAPTRTRLLSYGVGYRDNDKYKQLIDYFLPANAKILERLKRFVEHGERAQHAR